jgi:hypothetical protein
VPGESSSGSTALITVMTNPTLSKPGTFLGYDSKQRSTVSLDEFYSVARSAFGQNEES